MKAVRKRRKRKTDRERADDLVRAIYHARGRCARCGSTQRLQWAHILPRNYYGTRWLAAELGDAYDGALLLCSGCHFWGHKHPIEWEEWLVTLLGSDCLAGLRKIALDHIAQGKKTDYDALFQKAKEAGYEA